MAEMRDCTVGEIVLLDPADVRGPWTLNFPQSPINNDRVTLKSLDENTTLYVIITSAEGIQFPAGQPTQNSVIIEEALGAMEFVFVESLGAWILLSRGTDSPVRWGGVYSAVEALGTYSEGFPKNTIIRDGDWLMIANKITLDKPAPQPTGVSYWASGLGDTPAWEPFSVSSAQVVTGAKYTWNVSGFVNAYRVWIPVVSVDLVYDVVRVDYPGTPDERLEVVLSFSPDNTGWFTIPIGATPVLAGLEVEIYLLVKNTSTSNTFNGTWNYVIPNNETIPLAGEIVQSNKSMSVLNVSKTDDDAADRSADLATVAEGDLIAGAGVTWTVNSVTDQGTYIDFGVSPITQGLPGASLFTFTTYSPALLDYVRITDHYIADAQIAGLYSATGLDNVVENNNAYGVDIQVQAATISEDWDILDYSG